MSTRGVSGKTAARACGLCCVVLIGSAAGSMRPVTVRDGIEMTELASSTCGFEASFAPDGKKFVVVLRHGDLARNVNHYEMLLWKTDDLGPGGAHTILKMDSTSFLPAIDPSSIVWRPDGQSLMFLGEHPGGRHEVYQLNLKTRAVRAVTNSMTDVTSYSMDWSGNVLAYQALPPTKSLWTVQTARRGLAVTTQHVEDLISGKEVHEAVVLHRLLFVRDSRGIRTVQPMPGARFQADPLEGNAQNLSVSPNGRYLVTVESVPVRDIPAVWYKYHDWALRITLGGLRRGDSTAPSLISRYVLIDLKTGKSKTLLNAPIPGQTDRPVVWSPDSRSVILSQTLRPIDSNVPGAKPEEPERSTLEINVASGVITSVGSRCHLAVGWRNGELLCSSRPDDIEMQLRQYTNQTYATKASLVKAFTCTPRALIRFRKRGDQWRTLGSPTAPSVSVLLMEGMNSPPQLYTKIEGQHRSRMLLDLNPQFRTLEFAKESMVTWNWSGHQQANGGLYFPLNYRPGKRYPLVIQTHGFDPARFEFFGSFPTADAAQPLAARGMFVLQLQDTRITADTGWQIGEVDAADSIYKSAIAYLNSRGLIDPGKVGVIGFSRTCLYVKWTLVHDPKIFSAASVTEGVDDGYLQYLIGENDNSVTGLYGGGPVGQHLKQWFKLAPGFNLDEVRAPLLITVPNHRYVLYDWEWFEGLRDLGKAVYMVMFDGRHPDSHLLQIPGNRLLSSGGNVDWFDFWLNGRVDPDPAKAARYAEWRRLRTAYDAASAAGHQEVH